MSKILVFLGAGASKPFGIPTMKEFPEIIKNSEKLEPKEKETFENMESYLKEVYEKDFDLEQIMTILMELSKNNINLSPTQNYILKNYLNKDIEKFPTDYIEILNKLTKKVKAIIIENCKIKDYKILQEIYEKFFNTIAESCGIGNIKGLFRDGSNLDIFTTNYDLGIEEFVKLYNLKGDGNIKLNVGINHDSDNTWRIHNFTRTDNVSLFKIHGSIDIRKTVSHIIKDPTTINGEEYLGHKIIDDIMIYPTTEKHLYDEPYFSLFNHLKDSIKMAEHIFIIGFSFRDIIIKNIFISCLKNFFGQTNTDMSKKKVYLICGDSTKEIVNNQLNEIKNNLIPIERRLSAEDSFISDLRNAIKR